MASKRDYYEILSVARSATQDDIKRAFRKKARETHPDVNADPKAVDAFKEINEAYAVLSDQQKRAAYDRFGHSAFNGGSGGDPFSGFGGFADVADIFDELFGGGMRSGAGRQRQAAPRRGQDLQYRLTVNFEEAIFGTEKEIEFDRTEICAVCEGTRAEPGTTPARCAQCNGSGEVRNVRQTILGQMVNITACPRCEGRGEIVST